MEIKRPGLLIGGIIGGVLLLILILWLIFRKPKNSQTTDQAALQAQIAALQAQANSASTPVDAKANLLNQIAVLSQQVLAAKGLTAPPAGNTNGGGTATGLTWDGTGTGICTIPSSLNRDVVLKSGSKGPEVCYLQKWLNGKGANLVNDGQFGPLTQSALQKYFGKTSTSLLWLS